MEGKRTRGRQKIEIKRIESEIDRLVAFSKRKAGIYKKASELVTLCGAEIGIVIFSPAGKPFSYGHPSIESIANRFLNRNTPPPPPPPPANSSGNTHPLVISRRRERIEELNQQLEDLVSQIEREEERHKELLMLTQGKIGKNWFDKPIDDGISFEELQKMSDSLEELYQNMCAQIQGSSSSSASTMDDNVTLDINQMASPVDAGSAYAHGVNPNGTVPHGYGYSTAFY